MAATLSRRQVVSPLYLSLGFYVKEYTRNKSMAQCKMGRNSIATTLGLLLFGIKPSNHHDHWFR